jgi:hypothetical protein
MAPRRLIALSIASLFVFGFSDLTPESVECEHAAVALEACCPELVLPRDLCSIAVGCTSSEPLLLEDESVCIQDAPCDSLTELGASGRSVCDRMRDAIDEHEQRDPMLDFEPARGVCP